MFRNECVYVHAKAAGAQEVTSTNQKVGDSIPDSSCPHVESDLRQDTDPQIATDSFAYTLRVSLLPLVCERMCDWGSEQRPGCSAHVNSLSWFQKPRYTSWSTPIETRTLFDTVWHKLTHLFQASQSSDSGWDVEASTHSCRQVTRKLEPVPCEYNQN